MIANPLKSAVSKTVFTLIIRYLVELSIFNSNALITIIPTLRHLLTIWLPPRAQQKIMIISHQFHYLQLHNHKIIWRSSSLPDDGVNAYVYSSNNTNADLTNYINYEIYLSKMKLTTLLLISHALISGGSRGGHRGNVPPPPPIS